MCCCAAVRLLRRRWWRRRLTARAIGGFSSQFSSARFQIHPSPLAPPTTQASAPLPQTRGRLLNLPLVTAEHPAGLTERKRPPAATSRLLPQLRLSRPPSRRPPAGRMAAASPVSGTAAPAAQRIQLSSATWVDKFRAPVALVPPLQPFSNDWFKPLWALHPAERGSVVLWGQRKETPRWQQSYLKAYTFSGQTLGGGPLPAQLQPFLDWANSLPDYSQQFNSVLVNWYDTGHDYIGPHSDDETQLVPGSPILSMSLGATRRFVIKRKEGAAGAAGTARGGGGAPVRAVDKKEIEMPHGTVLVMGGSMQKEYKHEVPQISGQKGKVWGRRINLTFRVFEEEGGGSAAPGKQQQGAGGSGSKTGGSSGGGSGKEGSGEEREGGPPAAKRQRT